MTALSAQDVSRIGKIAARLESTHDGEVLNAARMLARILGGHGLRLADVVERGLDVEVQSNFGCSDEFRRNPSPPPATHRPKITALLADVKFMGYYLTRRSVKRLQSLYHADLLDPINMSWIDGLLEKAREYRAGRAA